MKTINYRFFGLCSVLMLLLSTSCKKDKMNFESDNRAVTENRSNSTARLINLAGYAQVIANGDTLTSFVVRNPSASNANDFPGTEYFPTNGRLGKSWFIPQDLFDSKGHLELDLSTRNYQGSGDEDLEFELADSYTHPTDYYIMPATHMEGQPEVVAVSRDVAIPSKPDHFKIRIVNLSGSIKSKVVNVGGRLEDLAGDVSLAYADGTLVNAKTNDVSITDRVSEYIELPYGTYQFRVLTQDGRQLPALGSELYATTIIDPATSTIPVGSAKSSNLTYAPIQTYQPGGIYTIVVAPQEFNYLINEMNETAGTYQNSFQIVSDNTPPVNNTYFKIQGANVWGQQDISFRIDGTAIGAGLSYGTAGEYGIHLQGDHKIEALDASGKVIATAEQVLRAAQNYTAWLYPEESGTAKLLIVANDLSGVIPKAENLDDATFNRNQYRYFFYKRFLNLSVGNPYITFTVNNGQNDGGINSNPNAGVNLRPGFPVLEQPYLNTAYSSGSYQIMAYRSKPNVIPGTWADDIELLRSDAFVASKALYEAAGRDLPLHEPGIFTVALIGQSGNRISASLKAKMIIIKHNK